LEQPQETGLAIAQIIRDKSEKGQLVQSEEILAQLEAWGLLNREDADSISHFELILGQVFEEHDDINELSRADHPPHYYSSLTLSQTYAAIFVRKEEDSLMAEVVRENSKIYPRPVPLDIFSEPPFDMTQEQISECLARMGKPGDYQDIAQTTTSIGTVFLYSSLHLGPDYAATLAEWLDVGQANNP
jgi:hypothetical protein